MTMSNTQQRELEQRIADDSEHAMAAWKADNYDAAIDELAAALARAEAAEAEAQRLSSEAGELFAVIAQSGETMGIPLSTPNLCQTVKARVAELEAGVGTERG